MDATGVIYSDTPDPSTDFVVGTVTCDKSGSWVITDTPNLIEVYVGTVQGFSLEMVTVSVQAKIHEPRHGHYSTYIYNQGLINSNEESPVLTDDPEAPGDEASAPVGTRQDTSAVVTVRFVGENGRPLRWWKTQMVRQDRWSLIEGRWWSLPGKL